MSDLPLACLYCATEMSEEDSFDYCGEGCQRLHLVEQEARARGLFRGWCPTCSGPVVGGTVRRTFCSRACNGKAVQARSRAREIAARPALSCISCGVSLAGRRAMRYCSRRCCDVARGKTRAVPLPLAFCALSDCGVEFRPVRLGQRCCSEVHGKKLWNRENPEPWNDRKRDNYHRRRALKKGAATGRPVVLAEIRERDKNRCHLCGDRVGAKAWPHPLSASLDHVVPLTKGGDHDPDNVKLAHLVCNTAKGGRGGNEQLLLIG